jgi:hypothetical protein
MIHLVYNGINEEARRKLSFQVHVVHVDTGAIVNLTKEEVLTCDNLTVTLERK